MKGPGIFLAQLMGDLPPFNSLNSVCNWLSDKGYKSIQIPTWDSRCFNLKLAAESKTYCDELKENISKYGLEISELSTHIQGQLVAMHPVYNDLFDGFAPKNLAKTPYEKQLWATEQLKLAALASKNLGLTSVATFSGSLMWHTVYPWPQRPKGLVKEGFKNLAERWLPILDFYHNHDVNLCYEIHPGEDLHDGITFERFLEATKNHKSCKILYDPSHFLLQQLDYIQFIDIYHDYIKMFHVKDAEFRASGKSGVYGGYQDWIDRPGRFRSLGDGQIDFKTIFSKLTQYNYQGWAVLEWECAIKSLEQGVVEGAPFIKNHLISRATKNFDDFVKTAENKNLNRKVLGIE